LKKAKTKTKGNGQGGDARRSPKRQPLIRPALAAADNESLASPERLPC
jgi:hypothetical protein